MKKVMCTMCNMCRLIVNKHWHARACINNDAMQRELKEVSSIMLWSYIMSFVAGINNMNSCAMSYLNEPLLFT